MWRQDPMLASFVNDRFADRRVFCQAKTVHIDIPQIETLGAIQTGDQARRTISTPSGPTQQLKTCRSPTTVKLEHTKEWLYVNTQIFCKNDPNQAREWWSVKRDAASSSGEGQPYAKGHLERGISGGFFKCARKIGQT